jgi:hypothetical protein
MVRGRVSSDGSYVHIDPDRLAAFVRDGNGPIMADLARRATAVQAGARRQVGKDTRRLERSIVKRQGVDAKGPFVLVVTEGVTYGYWHHEGNSRGWRGNRFLTDNLHLGR